MSEAYCNTLSTVMNLEVCRRPAVGLPELASDACPLSVQ